MLFYLLRLPEVAAIMGSEKRAAFREVQPDER